MFLTASGNKTDLSNEGQHQPASCHPWIVPIHRTRMASSFSASMATTVKCCSKPLVTIDTSHRTTSLNNQCQHWRGAGDDPNCQLYPGALIIEGYSVARRQRSHRQSTHGTFEDLSSSSASSGCQSPSSRRSRPRAITDGRWSGSAASASS